MMTNNQNHLLKNDHTQIILSYDQDPLLKKMIAPAGNHLHVVLPTELHLRELIQSGFDYNLSSVVQLVITQCKVIMKKLQGIATSFHREKTGIKMFTNSTTFLGNRI